MNRQYLKQKGIHEENIEKHVQENKTSIEQDVEREVKTQLLIDFLAKQKDIRYSEQALKEFLEPQLREKRTESERKKVFGRSRILHTERWRRTKKTSFHVT